MILEIFFLSLYYNFIILLLSPLKKGCGPLFIKIWIPSVKGFCSFKEIFNIILLFRFYLIFEKGVALRLNRFETTSPKDYAKFGWNWPTCSGEKDLKKVFTVILLFLDKGVALHLNKIESPSPNSLVEIGLVILKKKFFNFIISFLSHLWEGRGPSFAQTWLSLT